MTGLFDSFFKRSKHQVVRDNAVQGKDGEERVKRDYEWGGYHVKRTGRGHDYKATRRDWLTGKKETRYIEVKTGNGKLSPLQKKRKRSLGKKYVVERVQPNPFATSVGIDVLSSPSKSKKRITRTTKKRTTSKSKSSSELWGSEKVDFFGSSSSSKRKKSASTGLDSIWGEPKRKRTRKRKSSRKRDDPFGWRNAGF